MKFFYDNDAPKPPITTTEAYHAAWQECAEIEAKRQEIIRTGGKGAWDLLIKLRDCGLDVSGRIPGVLVSRCPFSGVPIWQRSRLFTLADAAWYQKEDNGRDIYNGLDESPPPTLFCIDGSLNLNGHSLLPDEIETNIQSGQKISIAAEVPFVKPRVLNLPTMVAVIHRLPVVDGRYTAYTTTYFAEQMPPQEAFCIGWARVAYYDSDAEFDDAGFIGQRKDEQDYDLFKWVKQGKLFWLDPTDEEHPVVRGPVEAFPYGNIEGKRHPYTIQKGKIRNLANPVQSKPKIKREYFQQS